MAIETFRSARNIDKSGRQIQVGNFKRNAIKKCPAIYVHALSVLISNTTEHVFVLLV